MKFTIQTQLFNQYISHVSRAVASKSTIPILTGIKLSVVSDGIYLIGSDADLSIEAFISQVEQSHHLTIESTGSVIIPARIFADAIRKLPGETVTIEVDDQYKVTISSNTVQFTLNGVDGKQYPVLPEINLDSSIELPTLLFKQMIHQTIISTSNQESRPVLTGIHLSFYDGYLSAVATDSHRLSRREIPLQTPSALINEQMTIPKKTALELTRLVEDNQALKLHLATQQLIFSIDNLTIYSRLIDGNYPETSNLIPTQHQTELVMDANELYQAVDRASLMARVGHSNVVMLDIADQTVQLSVQTNEVGASSEEIQYQSVNGEALLVSFNPDYMKEALKTFSHSQIRLQFNSAVRPILITAVEETTQHNQLIQLLTPIRTHYTK